MQQYFASKDTLDCLFDLKKKVDDYYDYLKSSCILDIWKLCYYYYYSAAGTNGSLLRTGEHGEYTKITVSDFRNLLQHMLILATSNRPAWDCTSINNDYKSKAQTIVGNSLLDYYMKEDGIEGHLISAVEKSLYQGEGFIEVAWNPDKGDIIVTEEGEESARTGNIDINVFSPKDVIRDVYVQKFERQSWVILRKEKNKYDLATEFPEYSDKILNLKSIKDALSDKDIDFYEYRSSLSVDTDLVNVWTFYHKSTPACPDGRFIEFTDDISFALTDVPNPYDGVVPVYRVAAADWDDTSFGYAAAFDLAPVQEALNSMYSTVLSNNRAFGSQIISYEKGSNFSPIPVSEGLFTWERTPGSPVPQGINLTASAPETYKLIDRLKQDEETLSGVNSVVRGDPTGALRGNSGAALALVQSQSVQFMNGLLASYNSLLENVGNAMIKCLKKFAQVPIMATIVGRNNKSLLQEFTSEDVGLIHRVQVKAANPLMKTIAGKVNLAENLLKAGMIKDPQEYLMVMQTGTLQPMIQGETSELLLITDENEKISQGEIPPVVYSDNHPLHIKEHNSVGSSTEARYNPQIANALYTHCQEHIRLMRETDHDLLNVLGIPSLTKPQGQSSQPQALDQPIPTMTPLQENLPEQPDFPQLPPNAAPEAQTSYDQSLAQMTLPQTAM